ncbi:MAG TPA: hypothetical protein VF868_11575 [Bacteroidia bacterium]|jgi:hypothetical protein
MKTTFINLLLLSFLLSCTASKPSSEVTRKELGNPPGTQKIAENLYLDQAEIRNLDYLEFLHWMKAVHGTNSAEYKAIYPDSNIWNSLIGGIAPDSNYLSHPLYRNLGVLGVSNKQAQEFAKWRSDRVMEFILIKYGVLTHKKEIRKESAFTIEKYFSGQHDTVKPNAYLLYYPEYKLLNTSQDTRTGFKNICSYKKWEPQK